MRLSEAIILGSVTCRMEATNWNSCAFGGALNANGVERVPERMILDAESRNLVLNQEPQPRIDAIMRLWPWTAEDSEDLNDLAATIYDQFDDEVCSGTMSLDELVNYVRSIEPDCDCNRFNCDCAKNTEQVAEVLHAQEA